LVVVVVLLDEVVKLEFLVVVVDDIFYVFL